MGVKGVAGTVVRAPRAVVVGFWKGLTYPFKGAKFVYLTHPGLIRIWIFPILITIVTLGLVLKGVWDYHDALVEMVWEEPTGEGFWVGLGQFFHGFVEILVAILGFLAAFVLVFLLSAVFAAPFNSALSEEVERLYAGTEPPPFRFGVFVRDSFRTVGLELLKLLILLLILGPLWVAQWFVPVVGQIAYTVIGYVLTALHLAVDYTDYTPERRGFGFLDRYRITLRRFLPSLGFGTGAMLFFLVPFVNLLFLPAAVAGGTLMYLDMEERPPRLNDGAAAPSNPRSP